MSENLALAVIDQLGGWTEAKNTFPDVVGCSSGANGGFHGFTYYADTVAFTKRNLKDVYDYAAEFDKQIEDLGVHRFISSFNMFSRYSAAEKREIEEESERLRWGKDNENEYQVADVLAKFTLEECARIFEDLKYN